MQSIIFLLVLFAYAVLIVAAWRAMKAHESIAVSLRQIASEMADARDRNSERDS